MHRLNCNVQRYGWGRRGLESKVAVFKKSQDPSFEIKESETYAELWMGTHPNCPSTIRTTAEPAQPLVDYIKSNPEKTLGHQIVNHFYSNNDILRSGDLPFLFKVLSINQALSIQAHPNKNLAAQLNKTDPKNYPDSNHKPEMLIAISEQFDALCGFRPIDQILDNFEKYQELVNLCTRENYDSLKKFKSQAQLKSCFSSLMSQSEQMIAEQLQSLRSKIDQKNPSNLESLFVTLNDQYQNDVGCFSIFLLNLICLRKGEAIFLSANVPHAYLSGDGVECMACSDNVVRAGLTPKFKDVKILCDMLDYSMKTSEENKLRGLELCDYVTSYRPSVDEFSVQDINVKSVHLTKGRLEIPAVESGSILIVTQSTDGLFFQCDGNKLDAKVGFVYYIDCGKTVYLLDEMGNCEGSLRAFRAFCDIK
ncbi:mannose-6-phosphate isomerase [Brachionus plicatilis]|uniref:mannose-6-phosphate isomerase n=1 Tax=Brachionus plicatilis TaxID=10195 RepID=A0A3M7P8I8_BRAPC|nr:mannose-6-phosphate isomerase [Brachionus plicatilis]